MTNFDELQHYKKRRPPWIKLYRHLLDDYEFNKMAETMQIHCIKIWLLASQFGNQLPFDERWIKKRIQSKSPIHLRKLLDFGWVEIIATPLNASKALADCKQVASLRREENRLLPDPENNSVQKDHRTFKEIMAGVKKEHPESAKFIEDVVEVGE